ncbi:hypothetical protein BCR32DRAFT_294753 [Anaeromyces robustus]|uniref:Uncharacterized protein n=1 Tax=Anaeromyces robustus TaxID=1754192 RepID=A0A1Y1WZE8_9FUNG|nr:hypothetical protein BCR32DRAFT_294753 [Anaeromyces robustus]|eukprot:ORX78931.1 hypothetical protein BCR32DRAFT_294753 [Anaeromyces robustus]
MTNNTIPAFDKTNIEIIENQKKNHFRSRSVDLVTINNTFSEMSVQPNIKSEKRSIDKINEIILGSEKYYIPERPVLTIDTKAPARRSLRTPLSEVNYNELLESLESLTSEVKNNTLKHTKTEDNKKEDTKTEKTNLDDTKTEEKEKDESEKKLKHSTSIRYLLSLTKKASNENLKSNEENNMPCLTDILQNSKNYLFNLAKKTQESSEETENNENKKIKEIKKSDVPDLKIIINSRKSSESTICKPDNDKCETTKNVENNKKDDDDNNSIVNDSNDNSVINLYSKNRDSINLDVYMNSEMFPTTPITPMEEIPEDKENLKEKEIINKKEQKEIKECIEKKNLVEIKEIKVTKNKYTIENIPLPEIPVARYSHKKSNSDYRIPENKSKSHLRRTYSKDKLEILKRENIEASYNKISNSKDEEEEKEEEEEYDNERNPDRNDSICYSNSHSLNNSGQCDTFGNRRNKSYLNQKNNNSNNLHKRNSQHRISSNRSSINLQDIENIKDITKSFYNTNKKKTSRTNNKETGKDVYYIKRLDNDIDEKSDKANAIRMYRNTRKLSDVTTKHRRTYSTSSNHSLPDINNSGFKYDKVNISPNLTSKTISPYLRSKNLSPSLMSKSPYLRSKNIPAVKSSLCNQSFNADEANFEKVRKLSEISTHEDSLDLMTSEIEKDKSMEKMMNNLEAIKCNINGEKQKIKEENSIKPSWAKNSSSNSSNSSNSSTTSEEEEKKEINIPSKPQRPKCDTTLVFTKRNSSLTRFSVVSARTRNSVAQSPDLSMKSKYYRYSLARNINTYNNVGNLPVPSHHTKLCIPHFNPNSNIQHFRKNSIDSTCSQDTLMMDGCINTSRVESSMIYSTSFTNAYPNNYSNSFSNSFSNPNRSFLFRDSKNNNNNYNINNNKFTSIINEIKEEPIEEPSFDFNKKTENKTIPTTEKKSEIVSKISNVTDIPFLHNNKDQEKWETKMHTMSLYDEDNPKPRKNRKSFRKTFSIFKKK